MIFTKNLIKISFAIFFLSFLIIPFITKAGFGLSPGIVDIKDALRGSSFEKVFIISRSNPDTDLLITVKTLGDTAEWFQFDRGNKFTYPAGEKQFPIKCVVTIPKGTPNGVYNGEIRFSGSPQGTDNSSGASVNIAMGALASITVGVTDQENKSFRLVGLQVDKAVSGEALIVALTIENTGNVDIQPGHLIVDLFDKFHKTQLASFTVSKFEGWAKVQSSGKILAKIPWIIPEAGNYWAEVSVFDSQNKFITKENLPFNATAGSDLSILPGASNKILYFILGGLGVLIIVLIIMFLISITTLRDRQSKELAEVTKNLIKLVKEKNNGKESKSKS